ncbi:hypothetical protein BT69DRAFT_97178 [Atractiella rhizophila]|nr:hypothetical protein BT69DRAFT_97178 [Atractiella rhizophila]
MWLELVLRWIWLVLNFTIRKELWNYYLIYAIVLLIAYLTNPNEALFRHFLNDLTFHRHLRKLHSPVENTPHVLTFNNRIKVTLRTPPYVIRSYLFFSTAVMSNAVSNSFQPQRLSDRHASSTQSLAATGRKKKPSSTASTHEFLKNASSKTSPNLALPLVDPLAKEKTKSLMMNTDVQSFNMTSREGFYLGAFGRWWKLDDGLYDDANEDIERVPYNVEVVKGVNEDGEKEVKFRVHIEDEDELEEEAASDSSDSPAAFQHSNTSNTNLSASTGSNGLAPPTTYHRSSARSSTTSYASPSSALANVVRVPSVLQRSSGRVRRVLRPLLPLRQPDISTRTHWTVNIRIEAWKTTLTLQRRSLPLLWKARDREETRIQIRIL